MWELTKMSPALWSMPTMTGAFSSLPARWAVLRMNSESGRQDPETGEMSLTRPIILCEEGMQTALSRNRSVLINGAEPSRKAMHGTTHGQSSTMWTVLSRLWEARTHLRACSTPYSLSLPYSMPATTATASTKSLKCRWPIWETTPMEISLHST